MDTAERMEADLITRRDCHATRIATAQFNAKVRPYWGHSVISIHCAVPDASRQRSDPVDVRERACEIA
ncbi:hypothetical protein GCM10009780_53460 [Actinomadura alba]